MPLQNRHTVLGRAARAAVRLRSILLSAAAFLWRSLLFRTTVIAITGSVGKTTAKECLAAILSAYYPTNKTITHRDAFLTLPMTVLRTRPWHRFLVAEVGTDQHGMIGRGARLLRPHIAIVLHVKGTHATVFATLDDTAAEKATLLRRLGRRGVAILNADDPRVMRMAEGRPFEVRTFGLSPGCDVWASDVTAQWPDRLTLVAHAGAASVPVRTQLVGAHWTASVLAALAAATRCGLTLDQAARRLADVPPFMARMQPVDLPGGAVLLRDEYNGSIASLDEALAVLRDARGARRWLVISDVADMGSKETQRMRRLAALAASAADCCVFIGERSAYARRRAIEAGMPPSHVHAFSLPLDAAGFLRAELGPDDLVLLRGRGCDHLARIVFAQFGTVACHKTSCQRRGICDTCPELGFQPDHHLDPTPGRPPVVVVDKGAPTFL